MCETVEGVSFLSIERVSLGFLSVLGDEHMFEIGDLFSILSKLDILKVLYLLLGQYQFVLALLIGSSELLLEVFHLLDEHFLVTQTLLKD